MLRFRRIATSLAIVLAAYWAYRLAAVPFIEPEAAAPAIEAASDTPSDGKESVRRHNQLLAQLYAEGAWQRDNPIVLEGDHVMLVMKDWRNLDNGRVELNPCTMIFFPSGDPNTDPSAVNRAIVMEAAQGAQLQFEDGFDIRLAKIGRLVGGRLPGPITIRGNSSGPGGQDELFVQTRDVQLDENRIWTPYLVDFRLGATYGRGREMQIHLLPGKNSGHGPNIGGLESFELRYEVTMHLQPDNGSMFPGDRTANGSDRVAAAAIPQRPSQPAVPPPPIDIACRGPFMFHLIQYVATFKEQVNVVRPSRGQQDDQMTCEKLSIFFAPRAEKTTGTAPAKPKSPEHGLSSLEPRRIEADGLPVNVSSPSTGALASGQHLEYDIVTGALKLEAEDEAVLHQQTNEARGRKIAYQPIDPAAPLADSGASGPPQVSITGAARMVSADYGQLAAEEIYVWLTQTADSGPKPGASSPPAGGQNSRMQPKAMCAIGNVDIHTAQVCTPTDRTIDKMQVWFKQAPAVDQTVAVAGATNSPANLQRAAPARDGGSPTQGGPDDRPQSRFEIAGHLLQMDVVMRGPRSEVDGVTVQGAAYLREAQTQQPNDKPMLVTGDLLRVENAATPQSLITVTGKPAHVEGRGLALEGATVMMSRGRNRLWIDGPGNMALPMDRDLQGHPLDQPRPVNVTWTSGMDFDGLTAQFRGGIFVRSEQQTMRTETMDVVMAQRIDFNQPPRQERPEVGQIICRNGVLIESRALAPNPPAVERMQVGDLAINQRTGEIHGAGPGWLTMVRLGRGPAMNTTPTTANDSRPASPPRQNAVLPVASRQPFDPGPSTGEPELTYLNIQFQSELTGNMNERQLTFHGQVHTIYGPIKTWDEQLNADRLEGLGPRGVYMSSDALKLAQMAPASRPDGRGLVQVNSTSRPENRGSENRNGESRGNVEMEASGNVLAEGMTFNARCGRLSYAEAKDLVVLEGDGRSDAHLYRQLVAGQPPSDMSARKLLYWRSTNRVDIDGARSFDLGQLQDGVASPRPPTSAKPGSTKPASSKPSPAAKLLGS